jgi:hypothetical protein
VLLILILVYVDHECPTIALIQKDLYPQLTHDHQSKLQKDLYPQLTHDHQRKLQREKNQQIVALFFLDLQGLGNIFLKNFFLMLETSISSWG